MALPGDPPQPTQQQRYAIEALLAEGSLGTTVQRATDTRSGEQVVLKTYNKRSPQAMVAYHREVAAFRAVKHHEYVVRLLDVIEDHHQVSLVFPLFAGDMLDSLNEHVRYDEADARRIIRSVTRALAHLHHHHVLHRDIKPDNILLTDRDVHVAEVVLSDFGSSAIKHLGHTISDPIGTPFYVAPEILKAMSDPRHGYGTAVDMFSLGVVTFQTLFGRLPFVGVDDEAIYQRIERCQYTMPHDDATVSDVARDFISGLLTLSASKRMTAEQALHHPWLHEPGQHQGSHHSPDHHHHHHHHHDDNGHDHDGGEVARDSSCCIM